MHTIRHLSILCISSSLLAGSTLLAQSTTTSSTKQSDARTPAAASQQPRSTMSEHERGKEDKSAHGRMQDDKSTHGRMHDKMHENMGQRQTDQSWRSGDKSREGRWYGQSDWSENNRSQQSGRMAQNQDRSEYNPPRSGAEKQYDSTYWDRYSWDENTSSPSSQADDSTLTYTYVIYSEPFLVGTTSGSSSAAGSASAQSQQSQNQQRTGQSGSSMAQQSGQQSTLHGEIEGVRQMRLQDRSGRPETFTLAKVKLDNGSTAIISLGEQNRLRSASLKKGDRIQATGQRGEIDGQSIFVARQLQAGGRTFAVNEVVKTGSDQNQRMAGSSSGDWSSSSGSTQQASAGQQSGQKTVQGRVAHFERAVPYLGQRAHTYVRLIMEDGRTQLIDLGNEVSLNQIDLQNGDRITVRGQEQRVGTRDVIVAQQLRIDGQQILPAAE